MIRITTGDWHALQADAMRVREDVFVREQHVPMEIERDDMDQVSLHAVAYDAQGEPVATGRLLPDGHIGRMAVLASLRGNGLGAQVLRTLMTAAQERGDKEVILSAQVHALGFYHKHGFVDEGDVYLDAGIQHMSMRHTF